MTTPRSEKSLAELIVSMDERGSLEAIRRRLDAGEDPLPLMDECRVGMERVGNLYEQGQYFISALIMAGEIFREAAEILIPRLKVAPRPRGSGTIVIATVKGDIHDIGKNIVITLLDAHGFAVVDLGVDVAPERIAEAVVVARPDVLGLSCLLTTGFESMRQTIAAVCERTAAWDRQVPVVIGGAPVDQNVCTQVGADGWSANAATGIDVVRGLLH
ncbi:MAG TPA: cobalamin-dependent protein [Thermoleophilia bacterium]